MSEKTVSGYEVNETCLQPTTDDFELTDDGPKYGSMYIILAQRTDLHNQCMNAFLSSPQLYMREFDRTMVG